MEVIENGHPVTLNIGQSEIEAIYESNVLWKHRLKLKEKPFRITPLEQDKYNFEARGVAGFIRVGNTTLEIAPKFLNRNTAGPNWRSAIWRFLAYGRGIEILSKTSGLLGVEEGIADLLADMFLASLRGASTRGYPLGYRPHRLDSSFISGRLDPKKFSKILPTNGKAGIITTKLTNDIPTNRLLKWAGHELAITVESPSRRKRLKIWSSELQNVSSIPPRIEQVPSPRHQYPHLTHAVEIAKLLYEDREVGYESGEINLPGFLWDSDDLFERATRRLLSEAARPLGFNVSKRSHTLAKITSTGKVTHTTPDIDVSRGTYSIFIADAKYKNLGNKPSNEDFYQVLAGGRVRSVPTVALLYPSIGTGVKDIIFKPEGSGNPTTVLVTTIGLESFASRAKFQSLRNEVTNWMVAATKTQAP